MIWIVTTKYECGYCIASYLIEHHIWINEVLMLAHPLRRWTNNKPTLTQCLVFTVMVLLYCVVLCIMPGKCVVSEPVIEFSEAVFTVNETSGFLEADLVRTGEWNHSIYIDIVHIYRCLKTNVSVSKAWNSVIGFILIYFLNYRTLDKKILKNRSDTLKLVSLIARKIDIHTFLNMHI